MILEGIVTTVHADGGVHLAAMGADVEEHQAHAIQRLVLRPYRDTATLTNLERSGEAVFHVTDDVELLAKAALHRLEALPRLLPAPAVRGWILADACRWLSLRVTEITWVGSRAMVEAEVVAQGRFRDFFGLNRAKHAVVEAAILASRIKWLPMEEIRQALDQLAVLVEKTGGEAEKRAFALVWDHVLTAKKQGLASPPEPEETSRTPSVPTVA